MKHSGSLFVVLFTVWLLWSGHYGALLLTLGLFSCLFVLLIVRRMGNVDRETAPFEITLRLLGYLPWLAGQVVLSNLDIAKRILRREMPIRPQVVRVRAEQDSDLARVIFANSITLTPGTVTIGMRGNELTVHALTDAAAAELASSEMNERVRAVEERR